MNKFHSFFCHSLLSLFVLQLLSTSGFFVLCFMYKDGGTKLNSVNSVEDNISIRKFFFILRLVII